MGELEGRKSCRKESLHFSTHRLIAVSALYILCATDDVYFDRDVEFYASISILISIPIPSVSLLQEKRINIRWLRAKSLGHSPRYDMLFNHVSTHLSGPF